MPARRLAAAALGMLLGLIFLTPSRPAAAARWERPDPGPPPVTVRLPGPADSRQTDQYARTTNGSTLWTIAEQAYGAGSRWPVLWRDPENQPVFAARGVTRPRQLRPGMRLHVPALAQAAKEFLRRRGMTRRAVLQAIRVSRPPSQAVAAPAPSVRAAPQAQAPQAPTSAGGRPTSPRTVSDTVPAVPAQAPPRPAGPLPDDRPPQVEPPPAGPSPDRPPSAAPPEISPPPAPSRASELLLWASRLLLGVGAGVGASAGWLALRRRRAPRHGAWQPSVRGAAVDRARAAAWLVILKRLHAITATVQHHQRVVQVDRHHGLQHRVYPGVGPGLVREELLLEQLRGALLLPGIEQKTAAVRELVEYHDDRAFLDLSVRRALAAWLTLTEPAAAPAPATPAVLHPALAAAGAEESSIDELSRDLQLWVSRGELTLRREEPMAKHTTFRVGGRAALYAEPATIPALEDLVRQAFARSIPVFILGGGSNLLVSDNGFQGVVVRVPRTPITTDAAAGTLEASGAEPAPAVLAAAARAGLGGLELLAGVPATIGGAVANNFGLSPAAAREATLPHHEIAPLVAWVELMDPEGHRWRVTDYQAGYRWTAIKQRRLMVLRVGFQLTRETPDDVRARIRAVQDRRAATQPLASPSAGSFFRNPASDHPAGLLIDRAGRKGTSVGGASVSPVHANFLVTGPTATASDLVALAQEVQRDVWEQWGLFLMPEVDFLGFAPDDLGSLYEPAMTVTDEERNRWKRELVASDLAARRQAQAQITRALRDGRGPQTTAVYDSQLADRTLENLVVYRPVGGEAQSAVALREAAAETLEELARHVYWQAGTEMGAKNSRSWLKFWLNGESPPSRNFQVGESADAAQARIQQLQAELAAVRRQLEAIWLAIDARERQLSAGLEQPSAGEARQREELMGVGL